MDLLSLCIIIYLTGFLTGYQISGKQMCKVVIEILEDYPEIKGKYLVKQFKKIKPNIFKLWK